MWADPKHTVCFGLLSRNLTPTSYIVLGLLELAGEASPYDLKRTLEQSVGNFWSIPHSQLYSEPARLAGDGYLTEEQDAAGRRRKLYGLTAKGRKALSSWREEPTDQLPELRDLSLLKLFFGADPHRLAAGQRDAHAEKLRNYEALLAGDVGDEPRGAWQALEVGIEHERVWVEFWSKLARDERPGRSATRRDRRGK